MASLDPQELPWHLRSLVARYRTLDELFSEPNLPMPRPILHRVEQADMPTLIGNIASQLQEPNGAPQWFHRRQFGEKYRTIEDIYKAPNVLIPRVTNYWRMKMNEPVVIPASDNENQSIQHSVLNERLEIKLGETSWTGEPKVVVGSSALHEQMARQQAPQLNLFRREEKLNNDTNKDPNDALECHKYLTQERDSAVEANGLERELENVLEIKKSQDGNNCVNHEVQEPDLVIEETEDSPIESTELEGGQLMQHGLQKFLVIEEKPLDQEDVRDVIECKEPGVEIAMLVRQESPMVEENELKKEKTNNVLIHTELEGQITMNIVQEPAVLKHVELEREVFKDVSALFVEIEGDNVVDKENASDIVCCQCASGDKEAELVLCDLCDLGYHTFCARPILPCVPIGSWICSLCSGPPPSLCLSESEIMTFFKIQEFNTGKNHKKRGKSNHWAPNSKQQWLPYVPSKEKNKRLEQLGSLARALQSLNLEFTNDLVYAPNLDPISTNQAAFERNEVQILQKSNVEIWKMCKAMHQRGDCPPLKVVYDTEQGFAVLADEHIRGKTFLCEFTGLVDFSKNREFDDSNCTINLLMTNDEYKDLVICQDKYGNVSHFLSGINNHKKDSKKKQNCTFVRYNVDGQCRIFVVSKCDIKAGTTLYCDYNGAENGFPTHNFV